MLTRQCNGSSLRQHREEAFRVVDRGFEGSAMHGGQEAAVAHPVVGFLRTRNDHVPAWIDYARVHGGVGSPPGSRGLSPAGKQCAMRTNGRVSALIRAAPGE